jgi:adenosylmethionine-8-amino-7-oxononanoate aminotransferase
VVIGRASSYHGNTIGALDIGGKQALRAPYEPWLGRFPHVDAAYEYRCTMPSHPVGCGAAHAEALDRAIGELGPANVAAFIAEPVAGATLAAAVPSDDYWPAMAEVCRRHGILLIADEVMTGFGRTGRWFGLDHWGVRPDILVVGKGSTSGYWPFGFAAASGEVFETMRPKGFVHGFTWSHNGVGAAVAHATLRRLRQSELVAASRAQGERLLKELTSALADVAVVGDVRGLGLMIGVELVADQTSKTPFARAEQVTERVLAAAREDGLLLYSSTGHVDGIDGDLVMLGPPFVISDEECALVVERTWRAVDRIA